MPLHYFHITTFFHRREYKNHPLIFSVCFLALRFWLMLSSVDSPKSRERQVVLAAIAAGKGKSQCRCRREHGTAGMWPPLLQLSWGSVWEEGFFFSQFFKTSIGKPQVSFLGNWDISSSGKLHWFSFLFYFLRFRWNLKLWSYRVPCESRKILLEAAKFHSMIAVWQEGSLVQVRHHKMDSSTTGGEPGQ